MKLWVQNTLLTGKEDPRLCVTYSEPHSDPAQFTVFTASGLFGSSATAAKLGEKIRSRLQAAGFDVRWQPAVCGEAAMRGQSCLQAAHAPRSHSRPLRVARGPALQQPPSRTNPFTYRSLNIQITLEHARDDAARERIARAGRIPDVH